MRTVAIDLLSGQARNVGSNVGTVAMPAWRAGASFEELFLRHYAAFAAACREVEEAGLAVVAVDLRQGRVDGILRLVARPERVTAAIVGRHSQADLFLVGCEGLALRHLAVLLEPARDWRRGSTDISYRILDLRTGSGFESEDGVPLVGVRCEGSALFRCGPYALLCLALGDPSDWPESARHAWSGIPERVFFDEVTAFGSGPVHRAPAMGLSWDPRITAVVRTLGVRELVDALPASEPPVGELEVTAMGTRRVIPVGAQALAEGILLGRYDRCQGWDLLAHTEVSRVHALIIQLRDRLVAVDTASTNGTLVDSQASAWSSCGTACRSGWGCRAESGFGGAHGDPTAPGPGAGPGSGHR
jgi:hypothetical protein